MTIRRVLTAAVLGGLVTGLVGCGSQTKSTKPDSAAPVGEQKIGKDKGRGMPAPPPIGKVDQ